MVTEVMRGSVRSITTPRAGVVWLGLEEPAETVRQELAAGGHPRRPVCRGDLDEVAGVLHLRQPVDPLLAGGSALDLEALPGEPPLIVHEGTSVLRVIERLRQTPAHLAMMPGTVEGIVTPADVLSAVASELPEDAAEESTEAAVRRAGGLWLVDGRTDVHRAERLLGAKA